MTEDWYRAAGRYIDMLRDISGMLSGILTQDERVGMLPPALRGELSRRLAENGRCRQKLETCSFDVAVVGLENSGKSTLANALVGLKVLPSASVRCTYTTTEIRADETDHARVSFFTRQAFEQRFGRMLSDLSYPDAASVSFMKLTLQSFDAYWAQVAQSDPLRHRMYDTTTAEDVRAILRSSALIYQYLDEVPRTFEGAEALQSVAFQSFITGCYDANDPLLRDERPFAVEKVTIWSSSLSHMQNVLLYDVPGFNSPTLVHKEQTRAMMDGADAIIMVADIMANPNIDGAQLSMLKETDQDNVPLRDKLFVFGNKADLLSGARMLRDNTQTFLSDIVRRHRLTGERRVLVGSAHAYFAALEGDAAPSERLHQLGIDDGIERLRGALDDYYNTERLSVLIKRVKNNNAAIMELLAKGVAHYEQNDADALEREAFALVIQAKDETIAFRRGARDIIGRMYRDISARKPFTQLLRRRIAEQLSTISKSDSLYQEILGSLNVQGDGANRNEMVNGNIRMNLQGYFNTLIERMVWDIAQEEEAALMDELTDELLYALKCEDAEAAGRLRARARQLVLTMFESGEDESLPGHSMPFRARGFIALITRFVPNLTATIIGYPLGSIGRTEEVARMSDELIRLYASRPEGEKSDDVDGVACLAKILTHQDYYAILKRRNRQAMNRFFRGQRKLRRHMDEVAVEQFSERWSALAAQYDIDLAGLLRPQMTIARATRKLTGMRAGREESTESIPRRLNNIFADVMSSHMKTRTRPLIEELFEEKPTRRDEEVKLPSRTRIMSDLIAAMAERTRPATTEDEIIEEINRDIEMYASILSDLLVPHLNLEKAFYERFINQINAMTGFSAVYDHRVDALVNDWLKHNVMDVKRSAFESLNAQRAAYEDRRRVHDQVVALLDAWEEKYAVLEG